MRNNVHYKCKGMQLHFHLLGNLCWWRQHFGDVNTLRDWSEECKMGGINKETICLLFKNSLFFFFFLPQFPLYSAALFLVASALHRDWKLQLFKIPLNLFCSAVGPQHFTARGAEGRSPHIRITPWVNSFSAEGSLLHLLKTWAAPDIWVFRNACSKCQKGRTRALLQHMAEITVTINIPEVYFMHIFKSYFVGI